ncbi:MAG: o-succinylbenzoate synthase, partial [Sphaerospermopsis sp. SIO1G2]|nr:o-succinylbenzoate synthase [Sphaerospermopsis sp. SIO1G2]
MSFLFDFRFFQQEFVRPIVTNYGVWKVRESIIVRLQNGDGKIAFGEISPLAWFGSETMEQAINFCDQLPHEIDVNRILNIPDCLPACQFGLESALDNLRIDQELINYENINFCGLLPSG